MLTLKIEDEAPAPFAEKVVAILNSVFSSDKAFSTSDAAVALNNLYPRHQPDSEPSAGGQFLWWFWDLVHDLARQVPHDSTDSARLAEIVKELHDLEPVENVDLGSEWGESQLWRKLPLLGPVFYDKWNQDPRAPEGADKDQRELNFQTYGARLAGHGLVPFEMYAVWALTDALEGETTPIRGAPDEVNPNPTAVDRLAFKVAAARSWITYAGHILYGRDEDVHGTLGGPLYKLDKKEAARTRRKYKGAQGLCPLRWQLWKERFQVVKDCQDIDYEVRTLAKEAFEAMVDIEEQHRA
ncbi:uncharacterized protein JN550_005046 [Neoarthrinium moseri]|uniref:uncharacterized protein n=1 Tax=Neoarthrinium moseri TaxID=1658444 RepID=UPI001FDCD34B|nr:uncharacterized protein JN550_005046 [Neoarthrinium moseri]KAI1870503.1 hypothetical protein JN550_005046 [Neoarthrinium moseri]